MGNYVGDAGTFLVDTIIGLYILAVAVRFLMQSLRVDFYNPIAQFIVTVTNPPVLLVRRFVPGLWGLDLACVVLMLALGIVKIYVVLAIAGFVPKFGGVVVMAIGELIQLVIYIFIVTMLVRIVLSWIAPGGYNPALGLIMGLTEPLMAPARRLLPPVSGLDLSPIIIFILLYLSLMLIVRPILDLGAMLAR